MKLKTEFRTETINSNFTPHIGIWFSEGERIAGLGSLSWNKLLVWWFWIAEGGLNINTEYLEWHKVNIELQLTGRAESTLWAIVNGQISLHWDRVILQGEMRGLITLVIRSCECNWGEQIKGHFVVGFGIVYGRALWRWFQFCVISTCYKLKWIHKWRFSW